MANIQVTRYQRCFSVGSSHVSVLNALDQFNKTLISPTVERGSRYSKWIKNRAHTPQKTGDKYFFYSKSEDAYYYINALYDTVMQVLGSVHATRGYETHEIVTTDKTSVKDGDIVEFNNHNLTLVEPDGGDFFYQNEIVDFVLDGKTDHSILEVQTGKGKTALAQKATVQYSRRIFIITKAAYVPKWKGDVTKKLGLRLKPGELVTVSGSKEFEQLIQIAEAGRMEAVDKGDKTIKAVIVSSHTFDGWLQDWMEYGHRVHPTELMELLGVGMVICDESHQLFRMNYWSHMVMSCKKYLDLSATLVPDSEDAFSVQRYRERFPLDCRYNGLEYDKYIDAYAIYYRIKDRKMVAKLNRMKMYNHTEFEKAIMNKPEYLKAYFEMVEKILETWFFKEYQKGQKSLIFFATQRMCTEFVEHMQKKKPDFTVRRLIQGDDLDKFVEADVCVSTPGKSGTAIDIPGLVISVITVVISKTQANLQILGRTRKVRDWDLSPKAVFLHADTVKKHLHYLKKRKRIFNGKVEKFSVLRSPFEV